MRCATLLTSFAVVLSALPAAADPGPLDGELFARISTSLAPDSEGVVAVPGPFAILPGERVAIYVPDAGGILVVEGERILHHFAVRAEPPICDLAASDALLVAGRRLPATGSETVELNAFDLASGEAIPLVRSSNPYLRVGLGEGEDLWQVVVEGTLVGVYHPPSAATFPLWDAKSGPVAGSEQMSLARAGVGLRAGTWVPMPDGKIERKVRGRTEPFASAVASVFVGGANAATCVVLEPADGDPAGGTWDVPREMTIHVLQKDAAPITRRLRSIDDDAPPAKRYVTEGRPVRVVADRLYWLQVDGDHVEIRTAPVPSPATSDGP
ncbi:MAG: hypothetical protein KC591_00895 [Gemmatimonadetes bacterium]|nr:hypothetical protein [Gemmatimonadota bacterium]